MSKSDPITTKEPLHHQVDVCVYGATPSGILAAISAREEGMKVVLVEPGRWVGGILSAGLKPLQDCPIPAAVGGLTQSKVFTLGQSPEVILKAYRKLLEASDVSVVYEHRISRVSLSEGKITAAFFDHAPFAADGVPAPYPTHIDALQVEAAVFIDSSYEGDLMAASGVGYATGREAVGDYQEEAAGVCPPTNWTPIDPYIVPGVPSSGLLPLIDPDHARPVGAADPYTQAYNYRIYLTSEPDRKIPLTPPDDYRAEDFELVGRYVEFLKSEHADDPDYLERLLSSIFPGWLNQGEYNYQRGSLVSFAPLGVSRCYQDGDWVVRSKIWAQHRDYLRGLHHFLSTDARVPAAFREKTAAFGLDRTQHEDTQGWPFQLYVRIARRMKGEATLTLSDVFHKTRTEESIGLALYGVDTYPVRRFACRHPETGEMGVATEGNMFLGGARGTGRPYPISYRCITPPREACRNLLVSVCFSASYIAYASARMEPVFSILGESAGVAAAQAVKEKVAVQEIDFSCYQARLKARGQLLEATPGMLRKTVRQAPQRPVADDSPRGQCAERDRLWKELNSQSARLSPAESGTKKGMKVLLGSLILFTAAAPSVLAQKVWQGGSGGWHTPTNWSGGTLPTSSSNLQFPSSGAAMTITVDENAGGNSVRVGGGTDLTLKLGAGVSITTNSSWGVGYGTTDASTAPARLVVEGPASGLGYLNLNGGTASNQLFINNGSTVILKGANLRVESLHTTGVGTMVSSQNNVLELQDGVIFNSAGFRLGWGTGTTGNSENNSIRVLSGSTLNLASAEGLIGSNVGHARNYLLISGAGSAVNASGQAISVGNSNATNRGGNYIEIANGGTLTTDAAIQIFGHDEAPGASGSNRLTVADGGVLTSSGSILVGRDGMSASSVLELHATGTINGSAAITVYERSVFKAVGSGLGQDVQLAIKNGGALETGIDEGSEPAVLQLNGVADFEEGSILKMALREGGADRIDLSANALLSGDVILELTFNEGDIAAGEWVSLFGGNLGGISATFDLSRLDANFWNVSEFNSTGGWRLQAIPEPASLAFWALGAVLLGATSLRGRRKGAVVAACVGTLSLTATGWAEEISLLSGEREVEPASEERFSAALPAVSPDHEAVLEFTAWYPAPKHAGYYAGMRVYFDHQELEDILDRPATFQTVGGQKEGKTSPIRRKHWWMVPVVPSPERFDPKDRMYVSPEQFNPFLFRFRLPVVEGGEYEVRITNSMKGDYHPAGYQIFPQMMLRDVVIRLEPRK